MEKVVLVVHLLIAVSLVGVVLIQKSEGGGLGIGGGTMGGLMTTRGSANLLTRTTAILAACFFTTSLVLAAMTGATGPAESIFDRTAPGVQQEAPAAPAPAPEQPPAQPAQPTVPVGQ
ncbi:preprotein translocase subunit SecG [Rhodocista pekingensis]|uniref:Protein-export membrane protein SecG n=1 Tax=Rhodocista pekingensis TaxID=201185 RepID=A0ABW2KQ02_9PROT